MTPEQQQALAIARARRRRAQASTGPTSDDALSVARTGLGGLIEGIPVAGPIIRGGIERAAAGTIAAFSDETYPEALGRIQRGTAAEKEAYPWVDTGAQVTGAIGGTIPMMMAAPAAFGAGSGGLLARTAASAGSGAALGGADAAVRSGGSTDEMVDGVLWGGGLGAAGPVVGKVVGAGARKALDWRGNNAAAKAAGTNRSTVDKIAQMVMGDGLDANAMRARLADLGPQGMIADLGANTQGKAGALAAMPGRGQQIMRTALDERATGANARLATTIDATMGRNVVPSQIEGAIQANQRALSPAYADAFRSAQPYDITPIADDLTLSISRLRGDAQRDLQRVRNMLNVHGTETVSSDPRVMFETRQAIDGMLSTEANPKVIGALSEVRQQLDDALTRAVPRIKEADAAYSELGRQGEAIGRGQAVLDHGRTAPRPSELAREFEGGALPQGMQVGPSAVPLRLRQGARAEIDRILGSNANDIARMNKLVKSEGDWNRERLATLFGADRADELFRVLDNELTFARTRDVVTRNSETARRQQHIAELGGSEDPNFTRNAAAAGGVSGLLRAGGIKAADKFLNMILSGQREASNTSLAQAMVSNRSALVDAIARKQNLPASSPLVEQLTRAILLGGGTSGTR